MTIYSIFLNTQVAALRLFVHGRDAGIGTEKYTELCETIENSRKIIIVMSNNYISNPACLREASMLAGTIYG